jgi:hypothetical protein
VVLSSAGVERVARPGGAGGARSNDAELVRSNPGAVLNWKVRLGEWRWGHR